MGAAGFLTNLTEITIESIIDITQLNGDANMKKPSSQKRTGKAVARPNKKNGYKKAKKAASKLGGASGSAAKAITKNRTARQKALKELG